MACEVERNNGAKVDDLSLLPVLLKVCNAREQLDREGGRSVSRLCCTSSA